MIPAGYMLKYVNPRPSWVNNESVKDILSVSGCFSEEFTDYINYWLHNGFWLFNKPSDMDTIIADKRIDRSKLSLFYYEVYERQYDEYEGSWTAVRSESSFETNVLKPNHATLQGYDVVTFSSGTNPECSPLSCNSLANEISVNRHCLFETFSESKEAIETGRFNECEPGPLRIMAVYTVDE